MAYVDPCQNSSVEKWREKKMTKIAAQEQKSHTLNNIGEHHHGRPGNSFLIHQHGIMFDVVAKTVNISVTLLAVDVGSGTAVHLWTKTGSHFGFETNVSSWAKIAGKIRSRSCFERFADMSV